MTQQLTLTMPGQTDLFQNQDEQPGSGPIAGAEHWLHNPLGAFDRWKRDQRVFKREFSDHSVEQYKSMFGSFMRWATDQGLTLLTMRSVDIERFLESKGGRDGAPASQTTRRRYLHLIHGVFEHLRLLELRTDNPAEPLLDLTRMQAFERPAPTLLPFKLADKYVRWAQLQPVDGWHDLRDKAMRLLFLASGLTVGELQALAPDDIQEYEGTFSVRVRAHGFVPEHEAPVAAFAVPALTEWRSLLARISPDCPALFPGRFLAAQVDRPDTSPISSAECYRIVQHALTAIGFDRQRQGPQTLRNTFVARQLREGVPEDRITAWLGLATFDTVQKIAKLVPVRADGVAPV